jgi:hypothetical protein
MGRNEPCHCGSGKKFKHCHGALSPVAQPLPPNVAAAIEDQLRRREAAEEVRKQQQG